MSERVAEDARELLISRHDDTEDFTLTTQTDMLEVFGNVMNVITIGIAAIAGISLVVGAIGILTIMWIAVGERTDEIGLLRALGATPGQVLLVFLVEARGALHARAAPPDLPPAWGSRRSFAPWSPDCRFTRLPSSSAAALAVSLVTGLLSGILPARRAAGLEPVEALRAE